jgi:hypothetical protein
MKYVRETIWRQPMANKLDDLRTDMNKCEGKLQAKYLHLEIATRNAIDSLSGALSEVMSTKIELEEKEERYHKYLGKE